MAPEAQDTSNGWDEYRRLVLDGQARLEAAVGELRKEVVDLRVDVGKLGVKASLGGFVSGALVSGLITFFARKVWP